MKKYYLILAAIAALTMTAQAQYLNWIEVGNFYNPTEVYDGSYFDMAPTNFYVPHTGAQMIYTSDLLTSMRGKEGVKIKYLNFKLNCQTYEEIVHNAKVYLREIDAAEFAINEDGVKQFFEFGDLVAEGRYDLDLIDYYYEDLILEFEMDEPFSYTFGKNLLVTIILDAEDDDNCTMGSDYAAFYTSDISGMAMTYTSNWNSFVDYALGNQFPNATANMGCGTNVNLPVTEIGYTYERMRGDVNIDGIVDIDDVTSLIALVLNGGGDASANPNADINDDHSVDIDDVTRLIDMILNGN